MVLSGLWSIFDVLNFWEKGQSHTHHLTYFIWLRSCLAPGPGRTQAGASMGEAGLGATAAATQQ